MLVLLVLIIKLLVVPDVPSEAIIHLRQRWHSNLAPTRILGFWPAGFT
jgi:hypothetical protein